MNLISTDGLSKISDDSLNVHDSEKNGIMKKLGVLVKKVIDCCLE
jgi:hypothetical protein